MPDFFSCPACKARFRWTPEIAGRMVKCQKCGEKFKVMADDASPPSAGSVASGLPRPPSTRPLAEHGPDPAEERRRRPRADDFDDDDEDDRPRRRRRVNDDDADDEDDDRPRRRRSPERSNNTNVLLIVGGVVLGVFVLCVGGVGYFFFSVGRAVNKVGQEFKQAVEVAQQEQKLQDPNARVNLPGQGTEVVFGADNAFTHNDRLAGGDPELAGKRYKLYLLPLVQGKTYQIDLVSGQFDPFLRLIGPDGRVVMFDDDSGGGLNARLFFVAPETGTFKVLATCFNFNAGPGQAVEGDFTLTVRRDAVAAPPVAVAPPPGVIRPQMLPPLGPIGNGTTVVLGPDGSFRFDSTITAADPKLLPAGLWQGKSYKVFNVQLEAGRTYQIDQASMQFDSFLGLVGPTGRTMAFDDDSGGNLNARIVFTAPTNGRYKIVATTLVAGMQGAFTLTIQRK